jgi:hypothetical protein
MATKKTPVIEYLYQLHVAGQIPGGIATQADVADAIKNTQHLQPGPKKLSENNPANFLKDIIRKDTANDHWPAACCGSKESSFSSLSSGTF